MAEALRDIFIRNLRFYRKQNHLSQEKLSYEIDMSMNYINQLENKSSFPPPEIIDKIAKVLGIRPVQLFDETECPENIIASSRRNFIDELAEEVHKRLKIDVQKSIESAVQKYVR